MTDTNPEATSNKGAIPTIKTLDNRQFHRFDMTIGELPTSYLDSMTYYEMLAWFCNYLHAVVVPKINELTGGVNTLSQYVAEYIAKVEQLYKDWEAYQADLNKQWADYQADLNKQWADYQADLNSQWDDYKTALNKAWADYKTKFEAEYKTFTGNINATITQLRADWETYKTNTTNELNTKFSNALTDLERKFSTLQTALEARVTALEADADTRIAAKEQEVDDYLANLPTEVSEDVKAEITKLINDGTIKTYLEEILGDPVDGSKIKDGSITGAKIADNTITGAKLNNSTIGASGTREHNYVLVKESANGATIYTRQLNGWSSTGYITTTADTNDKLVYTKAGAEGSETFATIKIFFRDTLDAGTPTDEFAYNFHTPLKDGTIARIPLFIRFLTGTSQQGPAIIIRCTTSTVTPIPIYTRGYSIAPSFRLGTSAGGFVLSANSVSSTNTTINSFYTGYEQQAAVAWTRGTFSNSQIAPYIFPESTGSTSANVYRAVCQYSAVNIGEPGEVDVWQLDYTQSCTAGRLYTGSATYVGAKDYAPAIVLRGGTFNGTAVGSSYIEVTYRIKPYVANS